MRQMKYCSDKPRMENYGYNVAEMTIGRLLADKAERNGEKHFLWWLEDDRRWTYRQLHEQSLTLARALFLRGVRPRTHVGVMMDNSPEQIFVYMALGILGAVAVPMNKASRGRLLVTQLEHSEVTYLVADDDSLDRLADCCAEVPAVAGVACFASAAGEAVPMQCGRLAVDDVRGLLKGPSASWTEDDEQQFSSARAGVRFSDLAMLCYTSGTTGPSKANMYAHAGLIQWGMTGTESYRVTSDDVTYICLPLSHMNANPAALWAAIVGDAAVALARKFSVSRFWHDIRRSGSTGTSMIGSMVNMLWAQPPSPDDRNHRMRYTGLLPVPPFAKEWQERFNVGITSSFGLSDFAPVAIFYVDEPAVKLGSVGRLRSGIELRIVDDDDLDVPAGESGEIIVRTNNPWSYSIGYFKNPEATAAANRHLWFHTGDRGYVDEDGYLYFSDRKKDSIRRRGENISAYEVEMIILAHDAVAEAAAYAVSSEHSEDEVAVSLILKKGKELDERSLVEYCAANMAHYMVPRYVSIVPDLPRTDTHKVQKALVREHAERNLADLWDREKVGIEVRR